VNDALERVLSSWTRQSVSRIALVHGRKEILSPLDLQYQAAPSELTYTDIVPFVEIFSSCRSGSARVRCAPAVGSKRILRLSRCMQHTHTLN